MKSGMMSVLCKVCFPKKLHRFRPNALPRLSVTGSKKINGPQKRLTVLALRTVVKYRCAHLSVMF
jgi:hypothetical protein